MTVLPIAKLIDALTARKMMCEVSIKLDICHCARKAAESRLKIIRDFLSIEWSRFLGQAQVKVTIG